MSGNIYVRLVQFCRGLGALFVSILGGFFSASATCSETVILYVIILIWLFQTCAAAAVAHSTIGSGGHALQA